MSVDAACTGCCCNPMLPCCACPDAEIRYRFNIVTRRLTVANASIPLVDWTDTLQLDLRLKRVGGSCYTAQTLVPIQDLGSSFSWFQQYREWRFRGGNSSSPLVEYSPNCRPCLTPELKANVTKSASGSTFEFLRLQCLQLYCPCSLTPAGFFWQLGIRFSGLTTLSGMYFGQNVASQTTLARTDSFYGSATNCLNPSTFLNSAHESDAIETFQPISATAPWLGLRIPEEADVPNGCDPITYPSWYPNLIECSGTRRGDVGDQSVIPVPNFTKTSKPQTDCARTICLQQPPIATVVYECGCAPYGGNNSLGLYQYRTTVSRSLSASIL